MNELRKSFRSWSSTTLSAAIIGVAVLLIILAFEVHSPILKAGILAYEVFP